MNFKENCLLVKTEITKFEIKEDVLQQVYEQCEQSKRIFILAAGRSLLMMKAFAMRLMHLGYEVHVLDEVTCPAITQQDCLIVASGSGTTSGIITKTEKAKQLHAKIIVWTQNPNSTLAKLSDLCIEIKKIESLQPGASLFEQTLLLGLDSFIASLMEAKQLLPDEIFKRHANLE